MPKKFWKCHSIISKLSDLVEEHLSYLWIYFGRLGYVWNFGNWIFPKNFQKSGVNRNTSPPLFSRCRDIWGQKLTNFENIEFFEFFIFSSTSRALQKGLFWSIGLWKIFSNDEKILKISFYHLQSLGSCRLASQLSANIFWASSGCLKLQKLDSFEKIIKKTESTEIPPCLVNCAIYLRW